MARLLAEFLLNTLCVLNSASTNLCMVTSMVVRRAPLGATLSASTFASGSVMYLAIVVPYKLLDTFIAD